MKYLCINSASNECTISLWNNNIVVAFLQWDSHRTLADEIFIKIEEILQRSNINYEDLNGLVIFSGPGSFTGLRISHTVFNTLAYSLNIPIVGAVGEKWAETGIEKLARGENDKISLPIYGGKINISKPKK